MAVMTLVYNQPSGYFSGSSPATKSVSRVSVSGAPTDSYTNYKVTKWTVDFQGQVYIGYGVTAYFNTNTVTLSGSIGEAQSTKSFTISGTSASNKILASGSTGTMYVDITRNGGSGTGNCALFKSDITVTIYYEYAYTACSAPTSVTVSNSTPLPDANVTLKWSGAAAGTLNPITKYEIYRATSAAGTYSLLETIITTSTSGSTTVTAPSTMGSSYFYKVKTIGTLDSSAYDSGLSSVYATVTAKTVSACQPPTLFIFYDKDYNEVTQIDAGEQFIFYWQEAKSGTNNAITGYQFWRSTDDKNYSLVATYETPTVNGSITFTLTPSEDTTYYYRIITVGSIDGYNSTISQAASITVLTYSNVGNITAKVEQTIAEEKVRLSWSAATDGRNNALATYLIQYQDSSDGSNWGNASNLISVGASALEYDASLNPTRGAYRRYLITPCGTKEGFNGSVATTAAVRTNRQPVAPQLLAPVAEVTYNEQPFVRVFLANEPDGQQQTIQYNLDDNGYEDLLTVPATGGTYSAQLPQISIGYHTLSLRVYDGMTASEETEQRYVTYIDFQQPRSPDSPSAERMNAFSLAINTMRAYYGLDSYDFDTFVSGDIIKASHFNELTKAQKEYVALSGSGHTFTTVKANDLIKRKDDLQIYNAIVGG